MRIAVIQKTSIAGFVTTPVPEVHRDPARPSIDSLLPVHSAPLLRPLSLRLRHLLPRLVVCPELLRHYLQRGIELHKRVLDGGMGVVARPAAVALGHSLGRFAVGVENV